MIRKQKQGCLYVFEGADAVGKTTLASRFFAALVRNSLDAELVAFPGRFDGSLGKHIYELHHSPSKFHVESIDPFSLQILHVAAHIDSINRYIIPAINSGRSIVLDRFWWSTKVYGAVSGVRQDLLDSLIGLELEAWGSLTPTTVFLIRRDLPLEDEPIEKWIKLRNVYDEIARGNMTGDVRIIDNTGSIDETFESIINGYNAPTDTR